MAVKWSRPGERILGRTSAEDVLDPVSNGVIVANNTLIEEEAAEEIERPASRR